MTMISPIRYAVEIHAPLSTPVPIPPSMSRRDALVIWILSTAMNAPMRPAPTDIHTRRLARSWPALSAADPRTSFMTVFPTAWACSPLIRGRAQPPVAFRNGFLRVDDRHDRHACPQEPEEFALRVQYDLDRNSLNDFRKIARRVVRGQQGELLSACRRDAVNMTLKPRARKRVDLDLCRLALADLGE